MIKAIIVEDSELARIELESLLSEFKDIELVGLAKNGVEAIQSIKKLNPELIFLDIDLPDMDGIQVLNEIDSIPKVIFTTAFDEYALKSFEYNTVDYLLKPIKKERLEKAIDKINSSTEEKSVLSLQHSIFIKDSDNCSIALLKDVVLFHTEGSYTKVMHLDKSPLLHKALNHIEERLDKDFFFRVNRQQIVNINHITGVEKWFKGKLKLTLSNGQDVEVSERQSVKLKQHLSF